MRCHLRPGEFKLTDWDTLGRIGFHLYCIAVNADCQNPVSVISLNEISKKVMAYVT